MVCRPTIKAARISIRTEREALEYAVMPASARLISSPMQTTPIRRNRSDIGLLPRGGIQTLGCHPSTPMQYQFAPLPLDNASGGSAAELTSAGWRQPLTISATLKLP